MHKYLQSAKTRIRSTRSDTQRAKAFILKNNHLVIPHKIRECAYQGSKFKIKSQLYWIVNTVIGLIRPAHDVLLSFGMGQLWVWSYFQSSLRLTENNKGYPALPVDTTLEYTGRSWCILSYQRRPCCKIRRKSVRKDRSIDYQFSCAHHEWRDKVSVDQEEIFWEPPFESIACSEYSSWELVRFWVRTHVQMRSTLVYVHNLLNREFPKRHTSMSNVTTWSYKIAVLTQMSISRFGFKWGVKTYQKCNCKI